MLIRSATSKARKLAAALAVPAWRRALLTRGVAAGVEHVPILRELGSCRTVVDIGANRGQFALAARQVFPTAHIISFEPLRAPATVYRELFKEDGRTCLHEAAIGPNGGVSIIHVSARDDSSSLLPIGTAQEALFPGTAEVSAEQVQVVRLADRVAGQRIESPALLKLDVQGFELDALRGCEPLIKGFAWIYVECSFIELYEGQALADAVIGWLRDRAFALCGVYNLKYDSKGRAIQGDFLFHQHAKDREARA